MMSKRNKKIDIALSNIRSQIRDLDYQFISVRREVSGMYDKVEAMNVVKHDMVKMDALVAMMSDLARRVDLAGIADLPNECVCETCGCKK